MKSFSPNAMLLAASIGVSRPSREYSNGNLGRLHVDPVECLDGVCPKYVSSSF